MSFRHAVVGSVMYLIRQRERERECVCVCVCGSGLRKRKDTLKRIGQFHRPLIKQCNNYLERDGTTVCAQCWLLGLL